VWGRVFRHWISDYTKKKKSKFFSHAGEILCMFVSKISQI